VYIAGRYILTSAEPSSFKQAQESRTATELSCSNTFGGHKVLVYVELLASELFYPTLPVIALGVENVMPSIPKHPTVSHI